MANRRAGQRKSANAIICDVLKHHNIIAIELWNLQFSAHWFLDDIDYDSMMSQIKAVPFSRKIRKLKKNKCVLISTNWWVISCKLRGLILNKDLEPIKSLQTMVDSVPRDPLVPPGATGAVSLATSSRLEFRATFFANVCLKKSAYRKKHI